MDFSDIAARLRKHADERAEKETRPRNHDEVYLLRGRILGVLIRDARDAAGLSIDTCAAQVGVLPETLSQWEYGEALPSLPQIELLAYCLNIPISHFWGTETLLEQAERHEIDASEYTLLRGRLIGGLLRVAREQANMTPEQLAAEVGIPGSHITAYELGEYPIPMPVLTSLAHACRVSLSYFLEDGNRVGVFLALREDLKRFSDMPEATRRFVTAPVNQSYLDLAMRLERMSTDELRGIAEAILNITL